MSVLKIREKGGTWRSIPAIKGDPGYTPQKNVDYFDGVSVNVQSVTETTESGGTNTVTFSDGNKVNIKNGEKGSTGQRGTSLLNVTTAPTAYTTAVNGITPAYRIALSTVKTQSGAAEVLVGDTVRYSYYVYPVVYVDASYVYCGTCVSIRGASGKDGTDAAVTTANITSALGYTPANAETVSQLSEEIDSLQAQGLQQTPLFANTIEECTDQSKLYVLPDGYIYAYMLTKEARYENLADPDSTEWLTDTRLSTSSTSTLAGAYTTNPIPCALDDVIRVKGLDIQTIPNSRARFHLLNADKGMAGGADAGYIDTLIANGRGSVDGDVITVTAGYTGQSNEGILSQTAYMRFCGTLMDGYTVNDVVITVNQEIAESVGYAWTNTGHAFVPADYEGRVIDLEKAVADHESRLQTLEDKQNEPTVPPTEDSGVPAYWLEELATKADAIQQAMEAAGRTKSAFLWYTDVHWTSGTYNGAGSAKVSPALLGYLYQHTPMNKVNFGGDIIGDPDTLSHSELVLIHNEWRSAIKGLPNHHSVVGNHDNLHKGQNDSDVSNLVYSFLIAPEESPDMVIGDGLYYYIDNPCEQTRYLYLDSGRSYMSEGAVKFSVEALKTAPDGWHVVAISHIWWQYSSASSPKEGYFPWNTQKLLDIFDAYNARGSGSVALTGEIPVQYDFAGCGGKVEFCVGGHIHADYDLSSVGGIPVILTTADVNQERGVDETEDFGTMGTTTEAAVYGIVADYTNGKINVIGVGRGGSREITI